MGFDKKNIGNIIITTHTFYPNNDGVAAVNKYLANGLSLRGYNVIVVTHKREGQKEEEFYNGIHIYRIYDQNNANDYKVFMKKLINQDDVLINICVQTPTTDLLLWHIKDIKCKKKILYVHGIWQFKWEKSNYANPRRIMSKCYNNLKWRMYYLFNRKNFKYYDMITQLHEYDYGNIYFKKMGFDSEIFENAADDSFFTKDDDKEFLRKYDIEPGYIVSIGNFDNNRNQKMVLNAFYKSKTDRELIFVGMDKYGYYSYLRKLEDTLKETRESKKVRYFVNQVPREDISKFVRNAKLFLFGSVEERFPVSIVEPMAAGIPFISTDVGVVKYFPGGVVVPINDVTAMSENIDEILNNNELWESYASEGKAYAYEHMRIEAKVDQLEKAILN